MIYIVGISIAFFLSLLLLSKKRKTAADKILTCWLVVMGIDLFLFYSYFSGLSYQFPFLLALDAPLPLVHGPLLFLYTASLTNQHTAPKKIWLLHFTPAVACWLYLAGFYMLPADQKLYIFQHKGVGYESFLKIKLVAIVISGITYVVWSLLLLKRHRIAILDQFSYTEKINLQWLHYLIYGIAVIWILIFTKDEILFIGVVLFVLFMGYFGIKQEGIFTSPNDNGPLPESPPGEKVSPFQQNMSTDNLVENNSLDQEQDFSTNAGGSTIPDDNSERKKYAKSGLTAEMAESLHIRLTDLMATQKIYTESELSLADLANHLDTLPNYISQVINEKEGKTFYDYINILRIQEFKRLVNLPENKKFTLLSLSFDCGFNSKSSFNKNFKKATGQSPSEYLHNLNIETAA